MQVEGNQVHMRRFFSFRFPSCPDDWFSMNHDILSRTINVTVHGQAKHYANIHDTRDGARAGCGKWLQGQCCSVFIDIVRAWYIWYIDETFLWTTIIDFRVLHMLDLQVFKALRGACFIFLSTYEQKLIIGYEVWTKTINVLKGISIYILHTYWSDKYYFVRSHWCIYSFLLKSIFFSFYMFYFFRIFSHLFCSFIFLINRMCMFSTLSRNVYFSSTHPCFLV